MKAERRHELRENDLIHALHTTRDYLESNGGRVGVIVVIAIILVGGITLTIRAKASAMDTVWRQRAKLDFSDLEKGRKSLGELEEMTAGVSDPQFVMDSLMDQGRQALRLAQLAEVPPDPDLNKRARDAFTALRDRYSDNPAAASIALLGLATVEENAFVIDGSPSHKQTAHEYLSEVVRDSRFNGLPTQTLATKRRQSLDQTFTKVTVIPAPPSTEDEAKDDADGTADAPAGTEAP